MAQKQSQAWMPGGTPIISTNECSNEVPPLEENSVENQGTQEDEGRLDDEEEDESSTHINEDAEELIDNNDAL